MFGLQSQVSTGTAWLTVFIGFCVILGCKAETTSPLETSRVTGASMSPTIWGDRARVVCGDCGIQFTANWQPELRPQLASPCWNCGGRLRTDEAVVEPGQQISIDTAAYRIDRPQIGDVVAIRDLQGTRIKRIVAHPGHTLSIREGFLFRDDQPMSADVPWMTVHDDSHRFDNRSWWESKDVAWSKTSSGFSFSCVETNATSTALLYCHQAPYQGNRSDVVRDDYPGNLTETRQLRQVNRLGLDFQIVVQSATTIELWHWTELGIQQDQKSFEPGIYHVTTQWEDAQVGQVSPSGMDAEHPIGIGSTTGTFKLHELIVTRPVIYWVDETRNRSIAFPLRLHDDEYFVVGDNVPLSIDSRHTGPIDRSSILGKVLNQ